MRNMLTMLVSTGVVKFIIATPSSVKNGLFIVFAMITVDTITGIIASISCKEIKSTHMRQKLVMKSIQYAILLTLAFSASLLSNTWLFFGFGLCSIVSIEATSMLENLSKFQKYSSANLGAISSVLNVLSGYFQVPDPVPGAKSHTVITASSRPDEDCPVVSIISDTTNEPRISHKL
jgi:phage-related holin